MRKVLSRVLEFLRELDRGMSMMRGEVMPGTYDRQRYRQQGHRRCHSRSRLYGHGTRYTRRHALSRRKNEWFGE